MVAAQSGAVEVVRLLLAARADSHLTTSSGNTALQLAIASESHLTRRATLKTSMQSLCVAELRLATKEGKHSRDASQSTHGTSVGSSASTRTPLVAAENKGMLSDRTSRQKLNTEPPKTDLAAPLVMMVSPASPHSDQEARTPSTPSSAVSIPVKPLRVHAVSRESADLAQTPVGNNTPTSPRIVSPTARRMGPPHPAQVVSAPLASSPMPGNHGVRLAANPMPSARLLPPSTSAACAMPAAGMPRTGVIYHDRMWIQPQSS